MATLDQIEGVVWPEEANETTLMRKCRMLRKKDLDHFDTEDFRLLVGQGISMNHLVPLILPILRDDVLVEGDFYCGDLLSALLRPANWKELKPFEGELVDFCIKALPEIESSRLNDDAKWALRTAIKDYINAT